jgi:XapX domain-containing protein
MKVYLVALGAGTLVGIIYGLLNVRSPAAPVVALVGLLGVLLGEQVIPEAKRVLDGEPINLGWIKSECVPHLFAEMPKVSARTEARSEGAPT